MPWPLEKKQVRNKITMVIAMFPEFHVVCRNVKKKQNCNFFLKTRVRAWSEGHTSVPWALSLVMAGWPTMSQGQFLGNIYFHRSSAQLACGQFEEGTFYVVCLPMVFPVL